MNLAEFEKERMRKTCTVKELAEMLNLSYAKALQLSRMKQCPCIKVGKSKRVILSKLDEFLESLIGEEI